jgi:hypothetical protein
LLVDIKKKEVSFPFGSDWLGRSVHEWDQSGQKIAYCASKSQVGKPSTLVVKDFSKGVTLFRLDLYPKAIVDITWAPDDQYVAILSLKSRLSYNPIKLLISISGHPIGYRTYYLDIYDMAGRLIYQSKDDDIGTFDTGGVGFLTASIVWTDKCHTRLQNLKLSAVAGGYR